MRKKISSTETRIKNGFSLDHVFPLSLRCQSESMKCSITRLSLKNLRSSLNLELSMDGSSCSLAQSIHRRVMMAERPEELLEIAIHWKYVLSARSISFLVQKISKSAEVGRSRAPELQRAVESLVEVTTREWDQMSVSSMAATCQGLSRLISHGSGTTLELLSRLVDRLKATEMSSVSGFDLSSILSTSSVLLDTSFNVGKRQNQPPLITALSEYSRSWLISRLTSQLASDPDSFIDKESYSVMVSMGRFNLLDCWMSDSSLSTACTNTVRLGDPADSEIRTMLARLMAMTGSLCSASASQALRVESSFIAVTFCSTPASSASSAPAARRHGRV